MQRLAAQIRELQPTGDRLLEIDTVEAFARGDAAARARAVERLRVTRDLTLLIALWDVATFLPDQRGNQDAYADALSVAALLTEPSRSAEMRVLGHVAGAHLDLAAGRSKMALSRLDRAAEVDPLAAAEYRASFYLLPWISPEPEELAAVRVQLRRTSLDRQVLNATPNVFLSVHNGAHHLLSHYLLGRLSLRLGDRHEAMARLKALEDPREGVPEDQETGVLARDLARGLKARIALAASESETATALLRDVQQSEVWYGWTTVSPFFSRSAERFLLAESLAAEQRYGEALRLFDTFAEHALYDLVYVAPSHLRRAEIHDTLGRTDLAVRHYRTFQELWVDCDADLKPWLDRVTERLGVLQSP